MPSATRAVPSEGSPRPCTAFGFASGLYSGRRWHRLVCVAEGTTALSCAISACLVPAPVKGQEEEEEEEEGEEGEEGVGLDFESNTNNNSSEYSQPWPPLQSHSSCVP